MRMDEGDPTELLRRMVEIPSVVGEEGELADYIVRRMRTLGLRSWRDDAGNAVGEIAPSGGPTIMLLGHLDTVPGQLPVYVRENVLYGRGTVDAKGPLAAMIWAAARAGRRCRARILVVGAVGEEGLSPGAHHLLTGPAPDAVFIGEPSGVDTVVLGYKGIISFSLKVTRPPSHTSSPAEKAVEMAVTYWQDIVKHLAACHPDGPLFERAIPTLKELHGNITQAQAEISCRLPLGFDITAFRKWLQDHAEDGLIEVTEEVPAIRSTRRDPVVRALSSAIRRHVGPLVTKVKLSTSDMNIVGPAWRVPIAAYGPGNSRLSHSAEERVDLLEYVRSITVLTDAIGTVVDDLQG